MLSRTCAEPRTFQLFILPCQWVLGGDKTRMTVPGWLKGYPIPYAVTLNNKARRSEFGGGKLLPGNWLPISQWMVNFTSIACSFVFHFFSALLNCPYFNPKVLSFSAPSHFWGVLGQEEMLMPKVGFPLSNSMIFWKQTSAFDLNSFIHQQREITTFKIFSFQSSSEVPQLTMKRGQVTPIWSQVVA